MIALLELNDGWSQIPPKQDGDYWMLQAKPWRSENPGLHLIHIKDGKRTLEFDSTYGKWYKAEFDVEGLGEPVWEWWSQHELLAAWRRMDDHGLVPPKITSALFERHAVQCRKCQGVGAVYDCCKEYGINRSIFPARNCADHVYLFLCYACGHMETTPGFYDLPRIELDALNLPNQYAGRPHMLPGD